MQSAGLVLAVLALAAQHGTVLGTKVISAEHPIEGVISLLQDLQAKAKDEHAAEAANYQKFAYWCKNSEKALTKSLAKHEEAIESLSAKVAGAEKEIEALDATIGELTDEIEKRNADQSKADKIREDEAATYEQDQTDLKETIDAFEQAIEGLEAAAKDQFLQTDANNAAKVKTLVKKAMFLSSALATEKQTAVFDAFLQEDASPDAKSTGRVVKYKSKSGGVIEMLKQMRDDFKRQLVEGTKEETAALNAYNLAKQAQDYAISEAEETKAAKETAKGDIEEQLGKDKEKLTEHENAKAEEEEQLTTVQTDCTTKATEWEQRTKTREGEIAAMAKAIEILAKVTHVRNPDTHEVAKRDAGAASFLQVEDPKIQVSNLLKLTATKFHSKALQRLATAIAAYDGPFDIINQKIQKMIFQLMAEQKDEDDHKAWCDLEVGKTEDSKADKEEKLEKLALKIEDVEAEIGKLTEKISENNAAHEQVVAYIQEETQIRAENKEENEAAIKDAVEAQAAIANAKAVLVDFYKSSGQVAKEPWEGGDVLGDPAIPGAKLIQVRQHRRGVELPEQPETWDASYTGVADPEEEGTGVIAILNKISEDFASMEAESKAQEETDQKAFDADMTEQAVEKGRLEQDTSMATSRKEALTQKLDTLSNEKKHVTKEHEAVLQYLKDLEPACITGDSSYEERKQARADEIEALRKAQTILQDAFKPEEGAAGGPAPAAGSFLQKK